MGECEVCRAAPSKYKCPACLVSTCSAACIKQHKIKSRCEGKRTPLGRLYFKRDALTAEILADDARLLEESSRLVSPADDHRHEAARRCSPGQTGCCPTDEGRRQFAGRAAKIGGLMVRLMPGMMTRVRANRSSILAGPPPAIAWTVECVFVLDGALKTRKGLRAPGSKGKTVLMHGLSDLAPLGDLLSRCVQTIAGDAEQIQDHSQTKHDAIDTDSRQDKHIRQFPRGQSDARAHEKSDVGHQSEDPEEGSVTDSTPRVSEQAFRLAIFPRRQSENLHFFSSDRRLRDLLSGSEVLEFPTIYVFAPDM